LIKELKVNAPRRLDPQLSETLFAIAYITFDQNQS